MILEGNISMALMVVIVAIKKVIDFFNQEKIINNERNILQLEEHIVSRNMSTTAFISHNHVEHKIKPLKNCIWNTVSKSKGQAGIVVTNNNHPVWVQKHRMDAASIVGTEYIINGISHFRLYHALNSYVTKVLVLSENKGQVILIMISDTGLQRQRIFVNGKTLY